MPQRVYLSTIIEIRNTKPISGSLYYIQPQFWAMLGPRRGVSTILGTLFFIGMLFSAIIPMQLVMKQADNIALQKTHEAQILDQEQFDENVEVYPVPVSGEDKIGVTIINNSEFPIKIKNLWINNTFYPMDEVVGSLQSEDLGPYDVKTYDGVEFTVKVTTERGNVFISEIGKVFYSGGDWTSETLGFRLIFPSRPGRGQRDNNWLNEVMVSINEGSEYLYTNDTMHWAVSASENFYEVDQSGTYNIAVYIWCKPPPNNHWEKIYEASHEITWPDGDPVIELDFAISGDELILE